jgi:hypothetical protein
VSRRVSTTLLATVALGCASVGNSTDTVSVPIYLSSDDVPCDYAVVRTVNGASSIRSLKEYERERAKVLGRAAEQVGADAVLIPESQPEPGRAGVGIPIAMRDGAPQLRVVHFSGLAIRFVDRTCSG